MKERDANIKERKKEETAKRRNEGRRKERTLMKAYIKEENTEEEIQK
jgi:hypothetical protein